MRHMTFFESRWVQYVLTAALLAAVVVKIQPQHLATAVSGARAQYLAVATILTFPFLYLKALRWHIMLLAAGIETVFWESALSMIGGMGLALITPARLGEVARAAYLRDSQKLKIGGLVMIDKGFDVIALAALSVAGGWRLLGPPVGLGLVCVTIAGLLVVYLPGPLRRVLLSAAARLPMHAKATAVVSSAESLTPRSTTVFLALTFASFAVIMAQFGLILLSWRPWSLDIVLLTFPLVILTNVLPITVGGLGVREGTAALLLSHYGVSAADAGLTALLSATVNTYIPGLVGAMLFPVARRGQKSSPVRSFDRG